MSRPARFLAALAILLLAGCAKTPVPGAAAAARKAGVVVRVATAERRDVPLELRAIGNVEALSSVAVKSRVAGQLQRVRLTDGQDVREGDVLFEIDPLPFQEQVRLAEANVARDRALIEQAEAAMARDAALARNARAQANRYVELHKQGVVSRDSADQFNTSAEAAEASLAANKAAAAGARAALAADQARLADARLQFGYTTVRAPSAGRAGFINVREGNLVRDNDATPLVTLLRVDPVLVSFAVPEQTLTAVRRRLAAGQLPVAAAPEGAAPAAGRLSFIDNTVDAATGMFRCKATFPNPARALWPGQFVNVTLRLETEKNALTIPTRAVNNGPQGTFVWTVENGAAAPVPVKIARAQAGLSVVASGLEAGATVVTEGQLRLAKGAHVEILPGAAR